jgi:xanthine dehydrogenase iron-sulfur cluster and FAD-binding subunit A
MKEGRLHLRLDEGLLRDMRAFAEARHTTVSEIVRQYFVDLLEEEKRSKVFDAPQI